MKIVIPSYNRPGMIKEKTLAFLHRNNVLPEEIDIIVETDKMKEEYITYTGPQYNYIVSNTKGVGEKRNFVRSYYRDETDLEEIVCIDDDIDDLVDIDKPLDLRQLIVDAFHICKEYDICMWGVCPFHNPFFMKRSPLISSNLKYICGAFFGLVIDRNKYLIHTDIDHGEDYQFTMEHYLRDGGVLRFNHISIHTKYFYEKGGICGSLGGLKNRQKQMKDNSEYLVERYEGMCCLKLKKLGYDIRLNSSYKN
jgi:hypothetical protein